VIRTPPSRRVQSPPSETGKLLLPPPPMVLPPRVSPGFTRLVSSRRSSTRAGPPPISSTPVSLFRSRRRTCPDRHFPCTSLLLCHFPPPSGGAGHFAVPPVHKDLQSEVPFIPHNLRPGWRGCFVGPPGSQAARRNPTLRILVPFRLPVYNSIFTLLPRVLKRPPSQASTTISAGPSFFLTSYLSPPDGP